MDLLDDELSGYNEMILDHEYKRKALIENYNKAYKLYRELITKFIEKSNLDLDLDLSIERCLEYKFKKIEEFNKWASIDIIRKFRDCDYEITMWPKMKKHYYEYWENKYKLIIRIKNIENVN